MSSPQLTDAHTSSEWFRTVAESETSDKARSAAQIAERRKRFVRLVTYTMAGLVAFTLLGVASFAIRQNSMRKALAAPAPAPRSVAAPDRREVASPRPTPLADIPSSADRGVEAAPPPPPAAAAANKTALPAAKRSKTTKATQKVAKRSPFLGSR